MPFLHGSQGCATYIRRYMISHFREPMDIASSNFSEASTVFGGGEIFSKGLPTSPRIQALDDRHRHHLPDRDHRRGREAVAALRTGRRECREPARARARLHAELSRDSHGGFHAAVRRSWRSSPARTSARAATQSFSGHGFDRRSSLPEGDFRRLRHRPRHCCPTIRKRWKGLCRTLTSKIPEGGTPDRRDPRHGLARRPPSSSDAPGEARDPGHLLEEQLRRSGASHRRCPSAFARPIGFSEQLEKITRKSTPVKHSKERARLVDAYVDGHKYVFGKRAVVLRRGGPGHRAASFLRRSALRLCSAGSAARAGIWPRRSPRLRPAWRRASRFARASTSCRCREMARELKPDFLIGNSKGQHMARHLTFRWCASASRSTTASAASAFCTWAIAAPSSFSTRSSTPCWNARSRNLPDRLQLHVRCAMTLDLTLHPLLQQRHAPPHGTHSSSGRAQMQYSVQFLQPQYDCANESRPGVTSAVLSPRRRCVILTPRW